MIVIKGTIEEIIFSNKTNGYVVCDISWEEKLITATGYMPFVSEGETLKIRGTWTVHPRYGEQLQVECYEKVTPETVDAIEKYLGSGVIKGIGRATAKKIIKKFGDNTLDIILEHPEKLSEIKGISSLKAYEIGKILTRHREFTNIVSFLHGYGISPVHTAKIYKLFGDKTIEEIKKNPYRLAGEISGISFNIADKIAASIGIEPSSHLRIAGGIKHVLLQAAHSGHTYLPLKLVGEHSSELLGIDFENVINALTSLVFNDSIHIEHEPKSDGAAVTEEAVYNSDSKVYLSDLYNAEMNVALKIAAISQYGSSSNQNEAQKNIKKTIDQRVKYLEEEEGMVLAKAQRHAMEEAFLNGALVITGGPGTGKTTIIKNITKLLKNEGYRVALAAPTGRAAKRITETTGFEAKTIHRLLETDYVDENEKPSFLRNELNPIDADIVIIDEMSMVDILLMEHLVKAIKPGTKLIMVGDVDQLPSVGPGNVLKDIILGNMVKTIRLTDIFRQAEESMIVVNAHRVNRGEKPLLNFKNKDFYYVNKNNKKDVMETIVNLHVKRIPKQYGYDPIKDIQVLTPMRKGDIGVAGLNHGIQEILNPKGKNKKEKKFPKFIYREGDRVMQVKNNYNISWERIKDDGEDKGNGEIGKGIFNGDTGIIQKINERKETITVLFDWEKIVEYPFEAFGEIEPAYAITIHKSQGSEFPVVIMPIFSGPPVLMTRNLLYTAITRARDLVIIVGSENMLYYMVNNNKEMLRYSGLTDKFISFNTADIS